MSFPTFPPIQPPHLSWDFPRSNTRVLSNGLRVVVLSDKRLPMVRARLVIPGGRSREAFGATPGVPGLTMRCARYGTERYSASELAYTLDSLGSQLSCGATLDGLSVSLQCLSEHLRESLMLLSQVVQVPVFSDSEVEREKGKIIASKRQAASSPSGTSGLWMGQLLFGAHPYGCPTASPEEVSSIAADDLRAFHGEAVRPKGAILVVVGDVCEEKLVELLETQLGGWSGQAPLLDPPEVPQSGPSQPLLLLDRPGSAQAHVLLGLKAIRRSHPDHLKLSCLNYIFGGGASGRLFKDLREARSLTYGCSSSLDSGVWAGDLVASLSCSTENTSAALDALLEQTRRICSEPVTEAELEACVRYKVGAWPKSGSTIIGLAGLLMLREIHGLPDDIWAQYPDALRALRVEDLLSCAEQHLNFANKALVVVGDASAIQPVLERWGTPRILPVEVRPTRAELSVD